MTQHEPNPNGHGAVDMSMDLSKEFAETMQKLQPDERTIGVAGFIAHFVVQAMTENIQSPDDRKAVEDLKVAEVATMAALLAAMGRDESTESPDDIVAKVISMMLADTGEQRVALGQALMAGAIENAKKGIHVTPSDVGGTIFTPKVPTLPWEKESE